eukprot:CAMPEP_0173178268 /NCGR_PEP_ID=MMETSP1141-20130122/5440_1 /TAXON_ID=483371 /ORGANISM="non described non described, Strain CCMP2298" /LENGTH=40 /DNA_ID= /DNA_START= /DNA_END= /DNA_ORIENTATION=
MRRRELSMFWKLSSSLETAASTVLVNRNSALCLSVNDSPM